MKPRVQFHFRSRMPLAILAATAALSVFFIASAHAQGIWHHDIAGNDSTRSVPAASIVDKRGDIITTGVLYEEASYPNFPAAVATIAYDRSGHMLWERTQAITFNPLTITLQAPQAYAALDSAGNSVFVLVTDYFNNTAPLLLKFSPTGKVLVDKSLDFKGHGGNPLSFSGLSVDAAHDDSIVLTGAGDYTDSGGSRVGSAFVAKLSASGKQLWLQSHNYANIDTLAIYSSSTIDSAGNIVICGNQSNPDDSANDFLLLKYDAAGKQIFSNIGLLGATSYTAGDVVTTDSSDDIYAAGEETGTHNNNQIVTAKFTPSGTQLWASDYAAAPTGNIGQSIEKIATDTSGEVIVGGVTSINTKHYEGMLTLVKYDDAAGVQDWAYRHSEGFTEQDTLLGLYTDARDNVFTVDQDSVTNLGTGQIEISRELASDGTLAYEHNYDGSAEHLYDANGTTSAFDPAIDGLYAVGYADFDADSNPFYQGDWYIVAYQP